MDYPMIHLIVGPAGGGKTAHAISRLRALPLLSPARVLLPMVIPPDRLPDIMLFLGQFSPATYAASALRQALLGPVSGQIAVDLAVLAGVSVVIFWLVGRKMDWRQS